MAPVSHVPRRSEGFVTRVVGDETVVVPVRAGVANLEAIFTMNAVGTAIWRQIDGVATPQDLAQRLCEEFAVRPEEALADVAEYLDLLASKGLLAADERTEAQKKEQP
ncbi:MAG: PqqD family protein [Verrucomicrobiota bacterium]